jgi:hypothetical protein
MPRPAIRKSEMRTFIGSSGGHRILILIKGGVLYEYNITIYILY